ncbi:MAG: hypothetical protein MK323_07990 [Gammaproteobacteria bacterium]|jgi:hypothetical protein|nr:hypothetical protein [Gammaproteobacteria bacterium]HAD35522.1 hypothetical protein [Gammaproteobacteria bacterium]HIB82750.1 hypothetical protein [Gammaproteobacteria bacterium]HIO18413.1 hypothetical protein [Gammaproteobacteria bacterium]|tara:strand:+ start:473 stop:709 length:237 start_codon:yes stop_codon:yes gene_type:complete
MTDILIRPVVDSDELDWRRLWACYLELYEATAAEAIYAAADEAGCPSVYWLTQHLNEAGRGPYDRIGWLTPFIRYNRE